VLRHSVLRKIWQAFSVLCPLLNFGATDKFLTLFFRQWPVCWRHLCRNGATFRNTKTNCRVVRVVFDYLHLQFGEVLPSQP